MEQIELTDRTAVITGAASGIGRALALEAVRRGMSVGLADVSAEPLSALAEEIRDGGGDAFEQVVDVRSPEAVEDFAQACFARFPSIAAMFANAGIIRYSSTVRPNIEEWRLVVDVDLMGPVHCVAAFLDRMIQRGETAQFVITGSQASFVVAPELASYAAAKHGVWALADILKLELEAEASPVGVSMIAPGTVHTGLSTQSIARTRNRAGDEIADKYVASMMRPEDAASLIFEGVLARRHIIHAASEFPKAMFDARLEHLG